MNVKFFCAKCRSICRIIGSILQISIVNAPTVEKQVFYIFKYSYKISAVAFAIILLVINIKKILFDKK